MKFKNTLYLVVVAGIVLIPLVMKMLSFAVGYNFFNYNNPDFYLFLLFVIMVTFMSYRIDQTKESR